MCPSAEAKVRLSLFILCSKNIFSPCGFLPAGMRRFSPPVCWQLGWKKKGNTEHLRNWCSWQLWIPPRQAPLSQQVSMSQLSTAMVSSQLHDDREFSRVGKSEGVHSLICQRISRFKTGRDIRNHPGPTHTESCQGQSECLIWCLSWLCRKLPSPLGSLPGSKLCERSSLTSRQVGIRVLTLSYSGAPRSLS